MKDLRKKLLLHVVHLLRSTSETSCCELHSVFHDVRVGRRSCIATLRERAEIGVCGVMLHVTTSRNGQQEWNVKMCLRVHTSILVYTGAYDIWFATSI